MCNWGDTVVVHLARGPIDVDRCISALVETLNASGIHTVASCCGHGNRPGNIALADGREIVLCRHYEEARLIDSLFSDIHGKSVDSTLTAEVTHLRAALAEAE